MSLVYSDVILDVATWAYYVFQFMKHWAHTIERLYFYELA